MSLMPRSLSEWMRVIGIPERPNPPTRRSDESLIPDRAVLGQV